MARSNGNRVEIAVVDVRGEPIANAEVTLSPLGGQDERSITLAFDQLLGHYVAPSPRPGPYRIRVEARRYQADQRHAQVTTHGLFQRFVLAPPETPFYYAGSQRTPFEPPKDLLGVTLVADITPDQESDVVATAEKLKLIPEKVAASIEQDNVRIFRFPHGTGDQNKMEIQESLLRHPAIRLAGPVIHLDAEKASYLTSEFICKFRTEVTADAVPRIAKRHEMQVIRRLTYAGNSYLLRSLRPASLAVLAAANELLKDDRIISVEPNLVQTAPDFQVNPTDFLFAQQWHSTLIDLPEAWVVLQNANAPGVGLGDPGDLTFGSENIILAVFDRGIQSQTVGGVTQSAHPDFTGTVIGGTPKIYRYFDFANMVANNDAPPNNHGMGCAGVATALANNASVVAGEAEGVAGAAPNCRVMALIRPAGGTLVQYADAYTWIAGFDPGWVVDGVNYAAGTVFPATLAPGADIISNSFLIPTGGLMNDVFDFVATYGRAGKGIPNFCAAGNSNINVTANNPMAAHEKAIAIAASTDGDVKADYSAFGNAIDLCAPSNGGAQGIVTCDLLNGGNLAGHTGGNLDYRNNFGGTSSATPLVAGVAALMLSIRPDLTWVQVREILRTTAVQIDFGNTDPVGQWVDTTGNGVANFSQWYGWGRVDAEQAVAATRDFGTGADIVVRDNLADTGAVPSTGWHANSPDIWVRRVDDPIPALAYGDAPPHQNPARGQDNYVFLRVRNVGTATSNEVYLRALITHFPGFEFRYPEEWVPTAPPSTYPPSPFAPGTYLIGEALIDSLAPAANTIVKIQWDLTLIPPEQVTIGGVTTAWHPCILADVTPHDGPAPAGATFDVKRNNNLAHKNITIDDPDTSNTDLVVAAVAGTIDPLGVDAVLIDRSLLPGDYRVFLRAADPKVMGRWLELARTGQIAPTAPLPGSPEPGKPGKPKPSEHVDDGRCQLTLWDPVRLSIECCDGSAVLIHAPRNTKIEVLCPGEGVAGGRPRISVGLYQGQQVIFFDGGVPAIELPLRLAGREYMPLILGIARPSGRRGGGLLQASQRKVGGEISPGYSVGA